MTLQSLAIRRQMLLELAYSGVLNVFDWQCLIRDYIAIGANFNAVWCIMKYRQLCP